MANLLIMATEFKSMKAKEKALKAEMAELEKKMIDAMNGAEEVTCGQYTISYKTIVSNVLNTSRLKAERPEVAEEFTEEKTTSRFTVR